jgi:hypothetical protein
MQTRLAPASDLVPRTRPVPTTLMYDASLVGRIAHGDKAAMQALFVRHQVRVYRFVLRLDRSWGGGQKSSTLC